jgi:hypothetical protein
MALPASGELKVSDIASEFNDTAPYQMSEYYRGAGKVPDSAGNASVPASGQIGIGNFYNAANRAAVALNITSDTQNYDIYTQASANPSYVAGTSDITVTVSPGVAVGSTSTGTYAMSVPNSFNPGDSVTIVNNGTVIGRGGNGGNGGNKYFFPGNPYGVQPGFAGSSGGNAVYVNFPTTITNNGTIAGGGGGGGGGASTQTTSNFGGGGGGGGAGYSGGTAGTMNGPFGAVPGTVNGTSGSAGTLTAGGAGGSRGGGTGGGQGANGSNGSPGNPGTTGGTGGTRGFYVVGNPLVTYPASGTLLGQVS